MLTVVGVSSETFLRIKCEIVYGNDHVIAACQNS